MSCMEHRKRIQDVMQELGIESYVMAMKDPDSSSTMFISVGDPVWNVGAARLLAADVESETVRRLGSQPARNLGDDE